MKYKYLKGNKSKENVADPSIRSEIRKTTEKKLPDTSKLLFHQ